ncbi:MAG: hypothetical protein WAM28_02750, partial [Chlamydiales bacterium]
DFNNIGEIFSSNPKVGEFIEKDSFGYDKYEYNFTPTQKRRYLAVGGVALGLASTIAIAVSTLAMSELATLGLVLAGTLLLGSGTATIHYFKQIDLDSPDVRREEIKNMRSHRQTLSDINNRYKDFDTVIGYQLMGDAPQRTYERAATLARTQAKVDEVYNKHLSTLQNLYDRAIAPAKSSLYRAQNNEDRAIIRRADEYPRHRFSNTLDLAISGYDRRRAEDHYRETAQAIDPVYARVKSKLEESYRKKTATLLNEFRQLPLN